MGYRLIQQNFISQTNPVISSEKVERQKT